jgi:hypothetical protein
VHDGVLYCVRLLEGFPVLSVKVCGSQILGVGEDGWEARTSFKASTTS